MVSVESMNTMLQGRIATRSVKGPAASAARTAALAAHAHGDGSSHRDSAAQESMAKKRATRDAFERATSSEEAEKEKCVFNIVTSAGVRTSAMVAMV